MNELTKHIQGRDALLYLFANGIVLVDVTKEDINSKLEIWKDGV